MTKAPRHWQPLESASVSSHEDPRVIKVAAERWNVDEATALARLDADVAACEYWVNDLYQVEVRRYDGNFVHLNIRRRDGNAALRDWRHFQEIKNQLIGPECEAVELYPAESRKVDTSNKYHLFGIADPTVRFPFGFETADVDYSTERNDKPGTKQRPF